MMGKREAPDGRAHAHDRAMATFGITRTVVYPETVRLCRPLRRRFERILRPSAVDMRLRKPCVLRRLRVCGWYVRFMAPTSRCVFFGARCRG
jgi:hypothetical protein